MALTVDHIEEWLGRNVVGNGGARLGRLEDMVFASDGTPLYGTVSNGRISKRMSLVPLEEASLSPDYISVPYDRATVRDAPQLGPAEEMNPELDGQAAEHYGYARRERPDGGYVTAAQRAQMAAEARAAEERAQELERRALDLGTQSEAARTEAAAAQERADSLAREYQTALTDAQAARAHRERLPV